jgi:hypothetical protein
MSSRLPAGGIEARYREVVDKIAGNLYASDPYRQQQSAHRDDVYGQRPGGGPPYENLLADWKHKEDLDDPFDQATVLCHLELAEERLCSYDNGKLHPVIQEFFNKFVHQYGHASIQECVGQPAVYVEGVSPFTAYLSFDNPLVAGQEFSTRAVRKKDWPICHEAFEPDGHVCVYGHHHYAGENAPCPECGVISYHLPEDKIAEGLWELHRSWLEVFEAEVSAWQVELRLPCPACDGIGNIFEDKYRPSYQLSTGKIWVRGAEVTNEEAHEVNLMSRGMMGVAPCKDCVCTGKKYPWIGDPQAFRPALDRARWAIPSTIQTGFCHTANTRVMGRVIADGMAFSSGSEVWLNIKDAYEKALPGMKGMWMREAVVKTDPLSTEGIKEDIDTHMKMGSAIADSIYKRKGIFAQMEEMRKADDERQLPGHLKIGFVAPDQEVRLWVNRSTPLSYVQTKAYARKPNGYLDPAWNQLVQVHIIFQCSWAVARDWHRHRTAFPWSLNIVDASSCDGSFEIHRAYKPLGTSQGDKAALMLKSYHLFEKFREAGDMEKAMLCIPFGTLVSMHTTMGLRDAVYMLELRANAHGANFEYEAQAKEALKKLKLKLGDLAGAIFQEIK